ncbi:DNA repair protein RecO [Chloroflexus islandicus]|uniref:DNA repair protein RecO n=1 Tax=Chloroflexus islandicus TaxID=1707952 RepID=A0A178M9G0_9CHLR|nr:DNA repair protein RecO [Chloroflexus islandicus]OAN45173.1 DNA repair protein RecO [Chloroflexus islandicus]
MRERVYRSEAVILRRSDVAEADRLLLIATPTGKRWVIAKGARKMKSRLAGHIELFTHAQMMLAVGRNLDIVTQSQIVNAFPVLRTDLTRLGCGYYVAELYDRLTTEAEENPPLFQLLVETLGSLDRSPLPELALRSFELHLLHLLGYRPQLHRCVVCDELLTPEADRYSPALGGVLCPRDRAADPAALPMSEATFRLLRYLQSQPVAASEELRISAATRREAAELLRASLRHLLERDLKSADFLDRLLSSR